MIHLDAVTTMTRVRRHWPQLGGPRAPVSRLRTHGRGPCGNYAATASRKVTGARLARSRAICSSRRRHRSSSMGRLLLA